jgi:hypothetical protein
MAGGKEELWGVKKVKDGWRQGRILGSEEVKEWLEAKKNFGE